MVLRRLLTCAATLALTVSAVAAAPAEAIGSAYVALGDSYSSGVGTGSYINDGTSCQRSVYAYPSLIASSKGYALNFRACSGATTADVSSLQLSALNSTTAYVTITVGGNDAGFSSVLSECALPSWASDCNGAINGAVSVITNQLPGRLASLYAAIRSAAPQAKVVAVGYPRLFNGQDCSLLTWFSSTEESRLNSTADLLDSKVASAAAGAGIAYSSPTAAFTGHAVCDVAPWLNNLSSPKSESFHPNRAGHSSGYTPLVGSVLTGSVLRVSAATLRRAAASAERLARTQRPYAAQDRTIRPETFAGFQIGVRRLDGQGWVRTVSGPSR